jgi:hypothetical protein
MRTSISRTTIASCCCFSFLVAFSFNIQAADLNSEIIGKWPSIIPATEQIEFLKDGTVVRGKDVGDYKWLDANRIRLDFSARQPSRVCTVQIEFGVLSLLCQNETYLHYLIGPNNNRNMNPEYSDKQPPKLNDYYPISPGTEWEFRDYFFEGNRGGKDARKIKIFHPKEVAWLPQGHFAKGKKLIRIAVLDRDSNKTDFNRSEFYFENDKVSFVDYILSEPDQIRLCAQEIRTCSHSEPDKSKIDYQSSEKDDCLHKCAYSNSIMLKGPIEAGTTWQRETMAGRESTTVNEYKTEYTSTVTTPMGEFHYCMKLKGRDQKTKREWTAWYAPGFGLIKTEAPGVVSFLVKASIK